MSFNPKTVIHYCAVIAFGGFVFGLDAALISGTVDYLQEAFSLDALQLGTLVGAPARSLIHYRLKRPYHRPARSNWCGKIHPAVCLPAHRCVPRNNRVALATDSLAIVPHGTHQSRPVPR